MSESSGEGHRTRRRAVRTAGPPVEENATGGVPAVTVRAPAATGAAVEDSGPSPAAADPKTAADQPPAGDARADAPKVSVRKADAEPSEATAAEPARSERRGLSRILATAAAALLVVVLVTGAVVSALVMHRAHERDEHRAEYVETARQAIVNLTTIRADSAKQDIDRILSLASGQFKTEFDGRVDPFTSIVQQAKVVSSGEIVEAALESDDDSSGRVLVAAKQTLTNAGQAEPQTRYYRFRVTVSRGDSGLTVSNVEFVA